MLPQGNCAHVCTAGGESVDVCVYVNVGCILDEGIQMSKEELDYDETKSIGGTTAIVVWREL